MRDESLGFSAGETIKVKVNFEDGIIIWEADEEFRCMHQSKKIKYKDIDWRPYVFLRDKGDSIIWIAWMKGEMILLLRNSIFKLLHDYT